MLITYLELKELAKTHKIPTMGKSYKWIEDELKNKDILASDVKVLYIGDSIIIKEDNHHTGSYGKIRNYRGIMVGATGKVKKIIKDRFFSDLPRYFVKVSYDNKEDNRIAASIIGDGWQFPLENIEVVTKSFYCPYFKYLTKKGNYKILVSVRYEGHIHLPHFRLDTEVKRWDEFNLETNDILFGDVQKQLYDYFNSVHVDEIWRNDERIYKDKTSIIFISAGNENLTSY